MARRLTILPETYAVARLAPTAAVPGWVKWSGGLAAVTMTGEELSIVCPEVAVPGDVTAERGWRAFKLHGPIAFTETGVLAGIAAPLAAAAIGIFALSTFDTDYVLVRSKDLARATAALRAAGMVVADG